MSRLLEVLLLDFAHLARGEVGEHPLDDREVHLARVVLVVDFRLINRPSQLVDGVDDVHMLGGVLDELAGVALYRD